MDEDLNQELLNTEFEKAYARCKACDSSFYPPWREEIKQFEDLCNYCLQRVYSDEDEDLLQGVLDDY